nr:PREDICTED: uncharacterized protein LOC106706885 [Latimeria chalumnae]|eukprot:XP_014353919.1 PREDICTED: uncharacterized protein LOC106706885 [Latimeria chalumnae]
MKQPPGSAYFVGSAPPPYPGENPAPYSNAPEYSAQAAAPPAVGEGYPAPEGDFIVQGGKQGSQDGKEADCSQVHGTDSAKLKKHFGSLSLGNFFQPVDAKIFWHGQVSRIEPVTSLIVPNGSAPPELDYLWYSLFTTICCFPPFGLVALVYSCRTRAANLSGYIELAHRWSVQALLLNHMALGLGITLYIFLVLNMIPWLVP